jgi:hypothetical protein
MSKLSVQRAEFLSQFHGQFGKSFQDWCARLLWHLHPVGDFQPIRDARGDDGLDAISIGSGSVYQMYAPTGKDQADRPTARKIAEDFEKALRALNGAMTRWVFIHNHASQEVGPKSGEALRAIRAAHPGVVVEAWSASNLWSQLCTLNPVVLRNLFQPPIDDSDDALPDLEKVQLRQAKLTLPDHYVPREALLQQLAGLISGQQCAGVCQLVARGDGGLGKTMLVQAYALAARRGRLGQEHVYTHGIYFISAGEQSIEAAFASLIDPASIAGYELDVAQLACLASAKLSSLGGRALLIIDNVHNDAQWASDDVTKLRPTSQNVKIIVTSRAESLGDLPLLQVAQLELDESARILASFRPSAMEPGNAETIGRIHRSLEGMALAIAAAGALMRLSPEMSWTQLYERIESPSVAALPDHDARVPKVTGDLKTSIVIVLDALRARLSTVEQLAIDLAAMLPQDAIPHSWLESLVDACSRNAACVPDSGAASQSGADAVRRLDALGLLTTRGSLATSKTDQGTGDEANQASFRSLHRLHVRRSHSLVNANAARSETLAKVIRDFIATRLDEVIGRNALFPAARADPSLRWELTPLSAYCKGCWDRSEFLTACAIASRIGFAVVELWRPLDAENCLDQSGLDRASSTGAVHEVSLPRALAWRGVWDSRNKRGDEANRVTLLSMTHHEARKDREPSADYAIDMGIAAMCIFDPSREALNRAEELASRAIELYKKAQPGDPYTPVYAMDILAGKQRDNGKLVIAAQTIQDALAIVPGRNEVEKTLRAKLKYRMGTVLTRIHDREADARAALEEALRLYTSKGYSLKHKDIQNTLEAMAALDRAIHDRKLVTHSASTPI